MQCVEIIITYLGHYLGRLSFMARGILSISDTKIKYIWRRGIKTGFEYKFVVILTIIV